MSPKQARFVAENAVDGNAAAAARRAGYSARSARVNGPHLLTNAAALEAPQPSHQPAHGLVRQGSDLPLSSVRRPSHSVP